MKQTAVNRQGLAMSCVLAAFQHPHGPGVPYQLLLQERSETQPKEGSGQPLVVRLVGTMAPIGSNNPGERGDMREFQATINFRLGEDAQSWVPYYIDLTAGKHCVVVGDCNIVTQLGNCNPAIIVRT